MPLTKLVDTAAAATATSATASRIRPLIDLTSLNGDERADDIRALCRKAIAHRVAAVCIYPEALDTARPALDGETIALATVINFPQGGDDIAAAVEAIGSAIRRGANEIDIVAPYQAAIDGDIGLVGEMIEAAKAACGPGIPLKVILETGALVAPELITSVGRAAVMAGADMLKTSTGKIATGATLEAVAVLLAVAKESGGDVGVKVSGGVRTADDAARYLQLIDAMMGEDWVTPRHVRFGASSLLDALAGG